jgi:hypothetical protein
MEPVQSDCVAASWGDRWIRWATTASVMVLAGIAAVVSYRHMDTLTLAHGESPWTAALIPVSVDGMVRHEVLGDRVEVRGLHRWAVAAVW